VDRLACAEIPALPLQLMLRRHPDWRRHPCAVVADDAPQSPVLWVNGPAQQGGVMPGLRYAAALAMLPDLRAEAVAGPDVSRAVDEVTESLRRFSPHVEPSRDEPGIVWLDASGLERLHASLREWAEGIRTGLARAGYPAAIAVGFTRFGTYAAARTAEDVRVFDGPAEEDAAARAVPLRNLAVRPETLDALARLGVRTVDDLLRLPAGALMERFGPAVERLHRRASGDLWAPLLPVRAVDRVRRHLALDVPETDAQRLVFVIKQLLDGLLSRLAARGHALAALDLRLRLDGGGWSADVIRPASPTLDAVRLADLVRLHLETVRVAGGITEIVVEAGGVQATPEQLSVAVDRPARELDAGTRALDRLRARYGDDVVVCASLRDGHLPEARFGWECAVQLREARPRDAAARPLIRRILSRPAPLPGAPAMAVHAGPFVVSGGWWAAQPCGDGVRETHRTYYFMEGEGGELWWVFFDRVRGRWYLHGLVE
jgi:protein ImuB